MFYKVDATERSLGNNRRKFAKPHSLFQFKFMLLPHGELFTCRPCCPCMVDRKASKFLLHDALLH